MRNYCDKIKYKIYTTEKTDFRQMADDLLIQIKSGETVLRLTFFGSPDTNEEYQEQRTILREKVAIRFPEEVPAFSYVAQQPLNARLIVEVHSLMRDDDDRVCYDEYCGFPYVILENNNGRFLYAGGLQSDVVNKRIDAQSEEVLGWVEGLLAFHRFPINSIIRQWNYIEQITGFQGENQHYQIFNNARSAFYEKAVWPQGYPAATGIGTNVGGVLIDLDAAVFTSPDAFSTPINNKLQVAAHAYSESVLKNAQNRKTTPKFERAKSMTFGARRLIYISGTAAIRGEESLKGVGLGKQLHTTMENIAQLTERATLQQLRVYLKSSGDYEQTHLLMQDLMRRNRLSIPISYVCADVCREELLIEIEGIAIE